MSESLYKCKHCKKPFLNERVFMKHECTQMRRNIEIQSIEGRMAYGLYSLWLQKQRRQAPAIETFLTSAYYTSFTKFAEWVRQTGIPTPEKYVELMVDNKISPTNWRRTEAYQIYLEFMDKRSDPFEQATVTIETLMSLAEQLECDLGQVFSHFKSGEIGELIQQRRLSPWLLFCSNSFKAWVRTLDSGDRNQLMNTIGIDWWTVKLERSKDIPKLCELAEQLGI